LLNVQNSIKSLIIKISVAMVYLQSIICELDFFPEEALFKDKPSYTLKESTIILFRTKTTNTPIKFKTLTNLFIILFIFLLL